MASFIQRLRKGIASPRLHIWEATDRTDPLPTDVAASPTITAGDGAPTHTEPQGSLYLRSGGSSYETILYVSTDGAGTWEAVSGSVLSGLTVTGGAIDLDPTLDFALDMDATKTATITAADNLASAFKLQVGSDAYVDLDSSNAAEVLALNNATTNGALTVLGTGQVTLTGNVDCLAGLDVSGADTSVTGGDFLFTGVGYNLDPTGPYDLAMDAGQIATIHVDPNLASAWSIDDGTNDLISIDTDTDAIAFGNAATNPIYAFLGSGDTDFSGNVDANLGLDVSGAGLTVTGQDVSLLTTSNLVYNRLVQAVTVLVAGSGGSTDGTLDIDVQTLDGVNVGLTKRIYIIAAANTGGGEQDLDASITFSGATLGSIVATGAGYCEALTDATGNFACTISNSADDATFVSVMSSHGVALAGEGCMVVECVEKTATWTP